MVAHRRKSWVLKSSSQGSTFTSLTDGRTNSFYQSRRSVAGSTGVLNAPQVVVSVTDEGPEAAQNGVQQKKSRYYLEELTFGALPDLYSLCIAH